MKLKFPEKLEPFRGIILFAIVLMISNLFWKYNVLGDEAIDLHSKVTFWGWDISKPFIAAAIHVATVCKNLLNFLGWEVTLYPDNTLGFATGYSVKVIWACTGIKQAFICTCIFLFARGTWKQKAWYIPSALLIVYIFNIFRISFITASIEHHPNWFEFLHLYAFKYAFYGIIFLTWVLWEEKIVGTTAVKKELQDN